MAERRARRREMILLAGLLAGMASAALMKQMVEPQSVLTRAAA